MDFDEKDAKLFETLGAWGWFVTKVGTVPLLNGFSRAEREKATPRASPPRERASTSSVRG